MTPPPIAREFSEIVEEIMAGGRSLEEAEAAVLKDLRERKLLVTNAHYWTLDNPPMPVTGEAFQ